MPISTILRKAFALLAMLLALLALVHPVAKAFARWDWRFDLLVHFQEPAFALSLAAAITLLVSRRRRLSIVFFALAAFQCEPVVRYYLPNPVRPASGSPPRLRILMANVLKDNNNFPALERLIREADPDIVALVETSPRWIGGLANVRKDYGYYLDLAYGSQGLSLWFKQKPYRIDPPGFPIQDGWPYLRATFPFAGETRHLWLIHPASPMRRKGRFVGYPELAALGDRIRDDGGSRIVIGDFNTTDGSPYFRDLLAKTGLRDSRLGFGRQGSWPVGLEYLVGSWRVRSPYRLAIDHAIVSDDLAVIGRRLGPSIGSDHLPLIVDLAPSAKASSAAVARDSTSAK